MGNYAIIKNGIVTNVIVWDGEAEIGLADGEETVLIPDGAVPHIGYGYKDGVFEAPAITDEEMTLVNTRFKASLTAEANQRIAVLTDATDPEVMGEDIDPADVALLTKWKAYRVKLSKVTDMLNPVWPVKPE